MNTRVINGLGLLLVTFLLQVGSVQAADTTSPTKLIKHIQTSIFARISQDSQLIKANPNHMKTIVKEELIPFSDYKRSAMFTLYSTKIKASPEEKKTFIEAYKNYLITSYSVLYSNTKGKKITYEAPKVSSIGVIIPTTLMSNNRSVNHKLRKNKKTGNWVLVDLESDAIPYQGPIITKILRGKTIGHAIDVLRELGHKSVNM